MNERIKELAEQAGPLQEVLSEIHGGTPGRYVKNKALLDFQLEKFAELIVRECAKTVEVYVHESLFNGLYERGYNDGRNASASLIKQHFGVEK